MINKNIVRKLEMEWKSPDFRGAPSCPLVPAPMYTIGVHLNNVLKNF